MHLYPQRKTWKKKFNSSLLICLSVCLFVINMKSIKAWSLVCENDGSECVCLVRLFLWASGCRHGLFLLFIWFLLQYNRERGEMPLCVIKISASTSLILFTLESDNENKAEDEMHLMIALKKKKTGFCNFVSHIHISSSSVSLSLSHSYLQLLHISIFCSFGHISSPLPCSCHSHSQTIASALFFHIISPLFPPFTLFFLNICICANISIAWNWTYVAVRVFKFNKVP